MEWNIISKFFQIFWLPWLVVVFLRFPDISFGLWFSNKLHCWCSSQNSTILTFKCGWFWHRWYHHHWFLSRGVGLWIFIKLWHSKTKVLYSNRLKTKDLGYYVSKIYSLNSITLVMNISNYKILRKRTSCFVKDLMWNKYSWIQHNLTYGSFLHLQVSLEVVYWVFPAKSRK